MFEFQENDVVLMSRDTYNLVLGKLMSTYEMYAAVLDFGVRFATP